MKKAGWFRRICDLEDQGRFDEAEALYVASTTPEERAGFDAAVKKLGETIANIPEESWVETEEIMKRFRALEDLPEDNYKRMIWERFWGDTTATMMRLDWRRHLHDPLARRGRRKGSAKITDEMLQELQRRIDETGEEPTAAARVIVGDAAGENIDPENRVDYLVRLWRQSGKK